MDAANTVLSELGSGVVFGFGLVMMIAAYLLNARAGRLLKAVNQRQAQCDVALRHLMQEPERFRTLLAEARQICGRRHPDDTIELRLLIDLISTYGQPTILLQHELGRR